MRLSVVIPCYNVEAYVAQTLRSLARNAGPDTEFLLVDDASTDATADLLEQHSREVPGSRVITCPRNGGLAAARNTGIRAATGDYLTFLDGDDFVAPGYYPRLLATIAGLGCDLVRTDHVEVRGRERSVYRINHGPRRTVGSPRQAILPVDAVTSVDAPHAWAGIYSRRLVDGGLLFFDEDLRTCEDRPWNWRLHLEARSFAVVGLLGVYYRRDVATSLTKLNDERQFDFLPAFDRIVDRVQQDRDAEVLLPKALRGYCAIMLHHLSQLDRYPAPLRVELTRRCRAALRRLPQATLAEVRAGIDPERDARLGTLLAAA